MKIYIAIAEAGGKRFYNQTVPAIFDLGGHESIYAGDLQQSRNGIQEGCVRHVPAAKLPVAVVGLETCSAVLYCYMKDEDLTDVVAFHSPRGGTCFTRDPFRFNEKLGTPTEEAEYYNITGYNGIYVVIANGESVCNYEGTDRLLKLNRAIQEGLFEIFDMLKGDKNLSEDRVFLYDCAKFGVFGISADKHIGEHGIQPRGLRQN
jgi:hypothetical protein